LDKPVSLKIMTMKNNYFVFTVLATLFLVACTKSRLEINESVSITSTKIIDLVMPSSSGLSDGKMVAINQSGHPTLDSTLSNFRFGLTDRTELYKNPLSFFESQTVRL
jgi:hypothetical protein